MPYRDSIVESQPRRLFFTVLGNQTISVYTLKKRRPMILAYFTPCHLTSCSLTFPLHIEGPFMFQEENRAQANHQY
ncbi:hypothetical protein NC651_008605 [Populus alba x Populus x berolinensis]|nr:hypothetical protein NC651_008605 [Populus alba x Populus x berolinensis]